MTRIGTKRIESKEWEKMGKAGEMEIRTFQNKKEQKSYMLLKKAPIWIVVISEKNNSIEMPFYRV